MLALEREPSGHPSARAVRHWRIVDGLAVTLVFGLATSIVAYHRGFFLELLGTPWLHIVAIASAAYAVVFGWYAVALPWLAVRYYRYELTDDAVYYARGLFTRKRTVIPYARVQSVKSTSGPIERRMGLTSLVLLTAAQAHKISMLDEELADELRERVCDRAREAIDDL